MALIEPVVSNENFEMIKDDNNDNGYSGQQIMGIHLSQISMLFAALYFRGFLFAKYRENIFVYCNTYMEVKWRILISICMLVTLQLWWCGLVIVQKEAKIRKRYNECDLNDVCTVNETQHIYN